MKHKVTVEIEFGDIFFDDNQVVDIIDSAIRKGYSEIKILSLARYSMPRITNLNVQICEDDHD